MMGTSSDGCRWSMSVIFFFLFFIRQNGQNVFSRNKSGNASSTETHRTSIYFDWRKCRARSCDGVGSRRGCPSSLCSTHLAYFRKPSNGNISVDTRENFAPCVVENYIILWKQTSVVTDGREEYRVNFSHF